MGPMLHWKMQFSWELTDETSALVLEKGPVRGEFHEEMLRL